MKNSKNIFRLYYKDFILYAFCIAMVSLLGYISYIYDAIRLPGISYSTYSYITALLGLILLAIFGINCMFRKGKLDYQSVILFIGFVVFPVFVSYIRGRLSIYSLGDIAIWPLLLLLSYMNEKKGKLRPERHKGLMIFSLVLLSILCIPLIIVNLTGDGLQGLAIRPTYFCLSGLPLVLYYCKGRGQFVIVFLISIVIFSSLKRTGIAALIVALMCFYFFSVYIEDSGKKKRKKMVRILLSSSFLLFIVFLIIGQLEIDVFGRFSNIQEDGASGRFIIWTYILGAFQNGTLMQKLFGNGYHAVGSLMLPGVYDGRSILAHNDFVEYIYDYGTVGAGLYFYLISLILYSIIRQIRNKDQLLPSSCAALIIFISISQFSYGIVQSTTMNFLAIYFGIMLARTNKYSLSNHYNTDYH